MNRNRQKEASRNSDERISIPFTIPFQELGPPFGFKQIIMVPEIDPLKREPNERQPTPQGDPGEYEVTFELGRPELGLTDLTPDDIDSKRGDSCLVITSPEPRPPDHPSGVSFHMKDTTPDGVPRENKFTMRPNKHGRMCLVVNNIAANSFIDAKTRSYELLTPMLSMLSFEYDIPVEIKKVIVEERKTGGMSLEFRIQFPKKTFKVIPVVAISKEISVLLAHYREGLNSTSINYSFLCFYRILEAIYDKRQKEVGQRGLRHMFQRENRINEKDLNGLDAHMPKYKELIGKKFRWLCDIALTPIRVKIAHGLLTPDGFFENTVDDMHLRNSVSYWVRIAQILARIEINNEFSKKLVSKN